MKYVNFKKISIKNFLSVGNDVVEIDFKTGLHIITGVNKDKEDRRNGVGKSTIADAIHFAIFGETLRELKKEFIINNKNLKGCQVVLELELKDKTATDQIKITRRLKPTKCFLHINGEDRTRDSIPNTTKAIHDMLSCTPDIFQNCVIMTVNNTVPFMAKKKVEKRKFIEGIFNLQVFSEMLLAVRSEVNSSKSDFEIQNAKFTEVEKTLNTLTSQKQTYDDDREKRELKLKTRRNNNANEIKKIEDELEKNKIDPDKIKDKINELNLHLDGCEDKISEFNTDITERKTNIKFKEKEKNKIGTEKDVCPTCLRSITTDDKDRIKTRKEEIDTVIENLNSEISNLDERLERYKELKTKLRETINTQSNELSQQKNIDSKKSRLNQLVEWNDEITQELDENKDGLKEINDSIVSAEQNVKDVQGEITKISNQIKMLETVRFIVSEEGVKSYIVKKILNLFNSKLAYYLNRMDANCQCTFNEYFEEEIINEKGKHCSYFNFSGAERKNIDLACLFAFMDIRRMQGDVAYNFNVYDELFDSSLDERGVELVLDILKERVEKYNECAMVISHRKESIKMATGDIIFLEKENGITRKVEFGEYSSN